MKTNLALSGRFPSSGEVSQLLQDIIEEALVEQKAVNYQFEEDNNLQQQMTAQVRKETVEQFKSRIIPRGLSVTEEEIEAYYKVKQHVEYKFAEAVKIRMIFLKQSENEGTSREQSAIKEDHKSALSKCGELYRRLKEGQEFGKLAAVFSNHKSAGAGGEMGYVPRGELPPEIEKDIFDAKIGLIPEPLESSYGFHIVEVLDHRQEEIQELTPTLRETIRKTLADSREKTYMANALDSLKRVYPIIFNYQVVSKLNKGRLGYEDWLLIVNGDSLTYTQLLSFYDTNPIYGRINLDSTSAMKCLSNLADTFIFLAAADELGLIESEPVLQAKSSSRKDLARQQILARKLKTNYNPTVQEIAKYYQDNKEKWRADRPISVQHIIFSDSAQAAAVRSQIIDGMDFLEAARKYYPGDEEIRATVANLGFIAPDEMPEEFFRSAGKLSVGEISQPVKTDFGWHLIKLIARQDYENLAEVNYLIKQELIDKHQSENGESWQKWISEGEKIWIDQDLLNNYIKANQ
ncbi:MAG: peptidylprolyl isomerase [candidate division Zixibacteria bacterium]|nr:peptidylprolyl isomerase [candidate division Zixibacteria bacterium]